MFWSNVTPWYLRPVKIANGSPGTFFFSVQDLLEASIENWIKFETRTLNLGKPSFEALFQRQMDEPVCRRDVTVHLINEDERSALGSKEYRKGRMLLTREQNAGIVKFLISINRAPFSSKNLTPKRVHKMYTRFWHGIYLSLVHQGKNT